jgi:hypothetical protein
MNISLSSERDLPKYCAVKSKGSIPKKKNPKTTNNFKIILLIFQIEKLGILLF